MAGAKNKTALIVGGLGVTGRAVLAALERAEDWDIIALSRRSPDFETRARFVSVDLLDEADARAKLSILDGVTHFFYCGLSGGVEAENVEGNLKLLVNSLGPVAAAARGLERVVLTQGGKYYGCQIGPHKTPSRESDPRHLPPNFYYDQEDYVLELAEGEPWSYTLVRPEIMIGYARGGAVLNTGSFVALYAAMCAELGVPFHFPGSEKSFRALNKFTDAEILGNFEVWAAAEDRCANEAFNITIGSMFRWENVWDEIGAFFGARRGRVMPFSLDAYLGDKAHVWDRIVQKHGLAPTKIGELANWPYADWVMARDWDTILDDTKRISYGFTEVKYHEDAFFEYFEHLRKSKVVP